MSSLSVRIGSRYVPISKCDWVLYGPCGCPQGVTVGECMGEVTATEHDAFKQLLDTNREKEIRKAKEKGFRVELITHERWVNEIFPLFMEPCPHG